MTKAQVCKINCGSAACIKKICLKAAAADSVDDGCLREKPGVVESLIFGLQFFFDCFPGLFPVKGADQVFNIDWREPLPFSFLKEALHCVCQKAFFPGGPGDVGT